MNSKTLTNMNILAAGYDIRSFEDSAFSLRCRDIRKAGYTEVYFGDIFFTVCKVGEDGEVLFNDPESSIVARSDDELLRIRHIVEEAGLAVGGAHFLQMLPAPGLPAEAIFPLHERLMEMAEVMGLSRLTTHAGWQIHTGMLHIDVDDAKVHADNLIAYRNLCRQAAECGINIAIESACQSWSWLDESAENLIEFIREVGEDNLGVCLDAGHCHVAGLDIPDFVRQLGSLLTETHFHDNFGRCSPEFHKCDLHNPIGTGSIDWREIILAMLDINYSGIITFEQSEFKTNAFNWREFMDKNIGLKAENF